MAYCVKYLSDVSPRKMKRQEVIAFVKDRKGIEFIKSRFEGGIISIEKIQDNQIPKKNI